MSSWLSCTSGRKCTLLNRYTILFMVRSNFVWDWSRYIMNEHNCIAGNFIDARRVAIMFCLITDYIRPYALLSNRTSLLIQIIVHQENVFTFSWESPAYSSQGTYARRNTEIWTITTQSSSFVRASHYINSRTLYPFPFFFPFLIS